MRTGEVFIHIHIPKTAGSMFNTILENNFKKDFIKDVPLISYRKYSEYDMRQLFYAYPHTCFASHNYSLMSIPKFGSFNITYFAFIRNPIDKVISSYFYLRNRELTAPWHITKKMSLEELIDYMIDKNDFNPFYLDTPQIDWLFGQTDTQLSQVEGKIDNTNGFIFPTERIDEACVLLERKFPEQFTDCSYPKKINESIKDYLITESEMEKIKLLPWISRDKELHDLSNQYLDDLVIKEFGSKEVLTEELKNFKERCAQKSIVNEPSIDSSKYEVRTLVKKVLRKFF